MTYWQTKAKALARKFGAIVHNESDSLHYSYGIEAPKGYIWNEGLHEFRLECYKGDPSWYEDAWKDVYERMEVGMDLCTDKDCEWCTDA